MTRAWIFALVCLAASASAQKREVSVPEPISNLNFSPKSHSLLVGGLENSYWAAPKKTPAVIPGGLYAQLFIGADEEWLGGLARTGAIGWRRRGDASANGLLFVAAIY